MQDTVRLTLFERGGPPTPRCEVLTCFPAPHHRTFPSLLFRATALLFIPIIPNEFRLSYTVQLV